jgi:hypothetical protein
MIVIRLVTYYKTQTPAINATSERLRYSFEKGHGSCAACTSSGEGYENTSSSFHLLQTTTKWADLVLVK